MCTDTYLSGSEWYYNTYTDSTVQHESSSKNAQINAECYNTEREETADVQMSNSAFWKLPPESSCKITNSGRCLENNHKQYTENCCITARKKLRISVGRRTSPHYRYFRLRGKTIYDSVKLDREVLAGGETLLWRKYNGGLSPSWRICAVPDIKAYSEDLYMCVLFCTVREI